MRVTLRGKIIFWGLWIIAVWFALPQMEFWWR